MQTENTPACETSASKALARFRVRVVRKRGDGWRSKLCAWVNRRNMGFVDLVGGSNLTTFPSRTARDRSENMEDALDEIV
jgi:hypothetical protein